MIRLAALLLMVAMALPARAEGPVPREWLDQRQDIAALEAQNTYPNDERATRFPELKRPFGFMNKQWEALKAQMRPGDEIWTFASPPDSWRNFHGRAGVALVRDGVAIDSITTRVN